MAREYTMTVNIRADRVYELKVPKNSKRTYVLINNLSAAALKFEFGTSPSDFLGETLTSGSRYERDNPSIGQQTIYIRGSLFTDQLIDVAQGFEG